MRAKGLCIDCRVNISTTDNTTHALSGEAFWLGEERTDCVHQMSRLETQLLHTLRVDGGVTECFFQRSLQMCFIEPR